MKIISDFKRFAMRGNVIDMAVGIIIGAAFGKIVSSLVADVVMPPIGVLLGGVDFSNLSVTIKEAEGASVAVVVGYGKFIQTIVDFIIIAFSIFALVKVISGMQRRQEASAEQAPVAAPSKEEVLLTEIRDLLKAQNESNQAPKG